MTRKKYIIIILIFLSALSILIYVSIHDTKNGGGALISSQNFFSSTTKSKNLILTPTPTILPTPTPIILDFKNELSKEVEKLTPEDFSPDFETLKKSF